MLSSLWNTILYTPLLNALALLVSVMPGGDVGLAVVILTIVVKLVLFPLSGASIKSQAKMALLAPELEKIKKSGATKEEQARQTFELYAKYKTNPFSGCLLLLIQIPIIFALYYVFSRGISFETGLYSFVPTPSNLNMLFLGFIDLSQKSILLAVAAGVSQYFQAQFMPKPATSGEAGSFQESFAKSMQVQMKYVFPFIVAFIAYKVSGAIALYWIISNIFAVGQQIYFRKSSLTPNGTITVKNTPVA
jgi:YidC/Oxa1 family membrane protein insertase